MILWQTRTDLQIVDLGGDSERFFAVRDTVSNEYFRFGEVEFFILEALKEAISLEGLVDGIRQRFGLTLSGPEVSLYLQQLATDNLVVAQGFGDGGRLYQQHAGSRSKGWLQKAMGLMSIKLPGFYPGPLLALFEPFGKVLFHPVLIALLTFSFLATTCFVVLSWQHLLQLVPPLSELLTAEHLFLMALGFAVAKLLHELGHGLACRRTGHECSEMGVLLLVMIPCLYCDVSDMWAERDRFKKLLVSLAGVLVELSLATICFWGWYFSVDGVLHRFLFGMMLVTSINTIFVNGNPLMRYDGYYAMSDLLGVHNLSTRAHRCFQQILDRFFFRIESTRVINQKTHWLQVYALLSFCYRWVILFAIGWMAWTFFKNQQLLMLGRTVVAAIAGIAVLPILLGMFRFSKIGIKHGIRWGNALSFFALLLGMLWLLGQIEFQHRVAGQASIQLAEAKPMFAPSDGRVSVLVADGDWVQAGDPIAEITNDEILLERLVARQQVDDASIRLMAFELDRNNDAAVDIEFWTQRRASWQRKLDGINLQLSKLTVKSPVTGRFVAQRFAPQSSQVAEERLVATQGVWTSPEHREASVFRGQSLGYVADGKHFAGTLMVPEKDIELVEKKQAIRVFLPFERRFLVGQVSEISAQSESFLSEKSAESSAQSEGLPQHYLVEFQFPFDEHVRIGSIRKAVILCRDTNVYHWLKRWLTNTFWL